MHKKSFLKQSVLGFFFSISILASVASSRIENEPTRCPNSRHITLSCGVEYDLCNVPGGIAGFFMVISDWLNSDYLYCGDMGIVEPFAT